MKLINYVLMLTILFTIYLDIVGRYLEAIIVALVGLIVSLYMILVVTYAKR